jgi:hypothetical protein
MSKAIPISEVVAELTQAASNLERYPFESATMAEAGRLAANAVRNVAGKLTKAEGRS